MTTRKYWVEFYYPGILVADTEVVERKDPRVEVALPKGAYGYRTYETEEETRRGIHFFSGRLKESPLYFVGKVLSLAEVKRDMPSERILISNMECNGYDKVVMVNGATYPIGKDWVQIQ